MTTVYMAKEIEQEVRALEMLDGSKLRRRWAELTGNSAPGVSPKLLRLALAWHIQAAALGGLSPSTRRKLAQAVGGKSMTQLAVAGTRLIREWQGVTHIVAIDENGIIRWNDREWRSLSAVARAITGGHWSGPAFFGLKKKLPKAGTSGLHEAHKPVVQGSESSPNKSEARASRRVGSSSATARQCRTAA